ncbi:uncharacterized protein LOC131332741 [Rhododendron vialii]|uniref:uncharacterized protein LOC131332741 n=1 Tax=Rhododendron vialii TaxID=182163 RepID=UPI00265D9EFA|nr:uncharacterized protein LOC131332741 [Rhododendron vialii]
MNPNMITKYARAFPLSDALCLPSSASKNEQGAPHLRPGVVRSEQGFLCVPGRAQEIKWVGEKAREIENTSYKLYYMGKNGHRNGVGIVVDKYLKDSVVTVTRKGNRIILVKLVIEGSIVNIISAYAPQVGLDDLTKE